MAVLSMSDHGKQSRGWGPLLAGGPGELARETVLENQGWGSTGPAWCHQSFQLSLMASTHKLSSLLHMLTLHGHVIKIF